MAYQDYQEYLRSPHWQETRQKRLEIDEHKCVICDSTDKLNVHHLHYKDANGKSILGNENVEEDLRTLCHTCHAMLHRIKETVKTAHHITYDSLGDESFCRELYNHLLVEIFCRDKVNGGDLELGGDHRYIRKVLKIVGLIFKNELDICVSKKAPDYLKEHQEIDASLRYVYGGNPRWDIFETYELIRCAMKCSKYREIASLNKVSKMFNCNIGNLTKVLTRYGWDAGAKIR